MQVLLVGRDPMFFDQKACAFTGRDFRGRKHKKVVAGAMHKQDVVDIVKIPTWVSLVVVTSIITASIVLSLRATSAATTAAV